jgi:hypothetical protein
MSFNGLRNFRRSKELVLRLPFALLLLCFPADSPLCAQTESLPAVRSEHPRLFLLDRDIPAIRVKIQRDAFAKADFDEILARGEAMLAMPVHRYELNGPEHTLLTTSRDVEDRVFTLAGLYRITGEKRFAERATKEMLAAAAFPDWYPPHFLDTAEMTAALAVGYDWLYSFLSADQRATIRTALVNKGLDPWIANIGPKGRLEHQYNNWAQVCNGGETLGALALADVEPEKARIIIDHSKVEMRQIMQLFAPDGGFEEGPVYWNYATAYNVLYLAALESALGTDFGLSQAPGFAETGAYRIQSLGPLWRSANFGDAHEETFRSPQMYWMANHFAKPEYTVAEQRIASALRPIEQGKPSKESSRFLIFDLIWYRPTPTGTELPDVQSFKRIGQTFLRSSWTDTNAWYVALKGGSAKASHGHLDLGSFVMDALGVRWAIDLGPESYSLPGYFGPKRWSYYRTRTEAHNTLMIDEANEDLDGVATVEASGETKSRKVAVLDLQDVYKTKLADWHREIQLLNGTHLLLQDEITPRAEADVRWSFHTTAQVKLVPGNREAVLLSGDKKLHVLLLLPATAQFQVSKEKPSSSGDSLDTGNDLTIDLLHEGRAQTISLLFYADGESIAAPAALPLAQWKTK